MSDLLSASPLRISEPQVGRREKELRRLASGVPDDLAGRRANEGPLKSQKRSGLPGHVDLKDVRDEPAVGDAGGDQETPAGSVDRVGLVEPPEKSDTDLGRHPSRGLELHIRVQVEAIAGREDGRLREVVERRV